ncbi:MAG: pentapeptide repeat-containing protein [Solirubrobacterales bacterium]
MLTAVLFVYAVLPGLAVDDADLTPNQRLERRHDARTAGLQALAGAVLALGGAFTAFSILSNREAQLDERFARSLDLLADKDPYVARGAVYSLERIAAQSSFDRTAVVDVLAGYLRDRNPVDRGKAFKKAGSEAEAALNVLSRVKELPGSPIPKLHGTDWKKRQLPGQNLSGVLFTDANFEEADLTGADLRNATLTRAKLRGAELKGADLRGANLALADLTDVLLMDARLSGAYLGGATLMEALVMEGTELDGTDFGAADLEGFQILGADLSRATLNFAMTAGARYTPPTVFPNGFNPDAHGMKCEYEAETSPH